MYVKCECEIKVCVTGEYTAGTPTQCEQICIQQSPSCTAINYDQKGASLSLSL